MTFALIVLLDFLITKNYTYLFRVIIFLSYHGMALKIDNFIRTSAGQTSDAKEFSERKFEVTSKLQKWTDLNDIVLLFLEASAFNVYDEL